LTCLRLPHPPDRRTLGGSQQDLGFLVITAQASKGRRDLRALILGGVLLSAPLVAARALTPGQTFDDYARHTWSLASGLPQVSVNTMAQGPDGYMWLGTQDGLARFDGVRFQNLLPSVWVQALLVDRSGTLWIGIYKDWSITATAVRRAASIAGIPPAQTRESRCHGVPAARARPGAGRESTRIVCH